MAILAPWFRSTPNDGLADVRAKTRELQSDASDPAASAWVRANAGTGKTHVLTMRVLRLLLAGTAPERILALTYTKAAAAEMSKRVFAKLADWVTDDDATLAKTLSQITGRSASADEMRLSRRLFAIAIETPGGLKVQTIHAFCERLLQRFSLEADVPPGFAILDDQEKAELLSDAMDAVLREATAPGREHTALAKALKRAVGLASERTFEELLAEALGARDWIEAAGADTEGEPDLARAAEIYARIFQVEPGTTLADIEVQIEAVIPRPDLERAKAVLESGSSNDQKAARRIDKVLRANGPIARIPALCDVFLTQKREKRTDLMTQGLARKHPELCRRLDQARDRIADLAGQHVSVQACDASLVLLRLASRVMAHYRHAKEQRAALDFDDLVAKAAGLLQTSSAVEWVLYKLDGGLDHILVDEAQDTAPLQWHVVRALAQEFFSGLGTGDGKPRTLFAVGDEKQSIYGFQGAAPGMFRQTGDDFRQRAEAAGMPWRPVPLSLSFRSVGPILQAVDLVFADPARTPGVGSSIRHIADRAGHAGHVEVWPMELPDQQADTSRPWEPLSSPLTTKPAARLAARIADTIAGWLAAGDKLASENRPVRAGDILILVRKRTPFAPVMVSALKARGIPVAGADRLILTDEIAVKDLVALGQVLVLAEDDLSLASLLKSPLFGFDDDDLLRLAPGRSGSLWQALQQDTGSAKVRCAFETLLRWRGLAAQLPPYEFYAALLDGEGQRARMLARLGPDASDPIDEFLNRALAYGEHAPPTLQGFLTSLGHGRHEIKRDMEQGRDEVRVMTVHGAKGLEAPIVFLPDTCHAKTGRVGGTLLKPASVTQTARGPVPFLWPVKGTSRVEAIAAARLARASSDTEERNRLLYVALTRPRDRLYVAGFQQSDTEPAEDCWYKLVHKALDGVAEKHTDPDGRTRLVLRSAQVVKPLASAARAAAAPAAGPLPPWAGRPAPVEPLLTVPLSPSRLAPLEMEAGDASKPKASKSGGKRPREPVILPPAILADEARFLRGTLTHALLEHLPTLPPARQEASALAFLAAQASRLSQSARDGIVRETLAILRHPAFAPLFGLDSRAEVALSAEIPRPRGQAGPALRLAGKIDRLVRDGNSVLIVDYKTNRPPPDDAREVADAYLLQLAAYRLAVQSIFPKCTVRSAILWTDGPRIMEIAPQTLDAFASKLWELDTAVLDA